MSLLTNDNHTPKGDLRVQEPRLGRISHTEEIILHDAEGKEFTHRLSQTKTESSNPCFDQDLSADDFKLKRCLELGSNLQKLSSPVISKFDIVDLTMANLHLLNSPQFRKPAAPAATVEPAAPAAPVEPAAPAAPVEPANPS